MAQFPENTFCLYRDTMHINFRNEHEKIQNPFTDRYEHVGVFHRVMNMLADIGFQVERDPRIERDYKCLSRSHRYGRHGALEFKADFYPAGFQIEFFQNVVFENRHGGEYDFDKYRKAPYLIRKQFVLVGRKVCGFLTELGYQQIYEFRARTAEESIRHNYVESWHHAQKDMAFDLHDLDGQTAQYQYNRIDRDGKDVLNGQIKYFRDRVTGRIFRGIAYHNINNMWWVILNEKTLRNIASFELFDLSDADNMRRVKKENVPQSYAEKRKAISGASISELRNEIRRRTKAAN